MGNSSSSGVAASKPSSSSSAGPHELAQEINESWLRMRAAEHGAARPSPLNDLVQVQQEASERRRHGYPALAAWMASTDDFFLLRRYSKLFVRTCLKLQDEIAQLESSIAAADARQVNLPDGDNGTLRSDAEPERITILSKDAPELLQRYYDLINAYSAIRQHESASSGQLYGLNDWFNREHPRTIDEAETKFRDRSDLFPVHQRPRSALWLWCQRHARFIPWLTDLGPVNGSSPGGNLSQPNSVKTRRYRNAQLDIFVSFFVVSVGFILLFTSLWLEEYIQYSKWRLIIVMISVLVFTLFCINATPSATRGIEVIAAVSAYTAVLVVYLQGGD